MTDASNTDARASAARIVTGGFLMGVANLVPGVSGGTMILAIGLYDRFIEAVARATSLRWTRASIGFLVLLVLGAGVAVLSLSAPAVWLVTEHRWVAYSLFVGMTMGGAPLLWKSLRPLSAASATAFLASLVGMVWVARGLADSPLQQGFLTFLAVGSLAAASMILPGISGSYILLIFGMYDVVVGSLRPRELLEAPLASLSILVPVGIGVALGIGLLSNVLKLVLSRYERPAHAALLGLLLGSVAGLYPFQDAVHEDLVSKDRIEAVVLALEGADGATIEQETGVTLAEADLARLNAAYAGRTKRELKLLALELETYPPGPTRVAVSLALLVGGFLFTRMLGRE